MKALRGGEYNDSNRTILSEAEIRRALRGWHAELEWKPQDLWIGAFWKRTGNCIDLWICLLPCVPLHVSWWWSDRKQN